MTINYARESVIDFTKPFMNLGISILFKAPKDPATEVGICINISNRGQFCMPFLAFLIHEPFGLGDLAIHLICLHSCVNHNLDCGQIFPL